MYKVKNDDDVIYHLGDVVLGDIDAVEDIANIGNMDPELIITINNTIILTLYFFIFIFI